MSPRRVKPQTGYVLKQFREFSRGLDTGYPTAIPEDALVAAENVEITLEGKIKPRPGMRKRYSADFDPSPVVGLGALYKSDGTTRLVAAAGTTLYADRPHVVFDYDGQPDWEQSGVYKNTDTATSPGDVKLYTDFADGFETATFDRWTSHDSGWVIDNTVFKTGSYSTKGTGAAQKLLYDLKRNSFQAYVKLACRLAETNQQHFPVIFKSPTDTEIQAVVADADGSFKYHNGTALTAFPVAKTYAVDTWYVVEVWVRGGTFWVSVDGQSLTPDGLAMKDTANTPQTQVAKVQIQNAGATSATMWVDDVEISALAAVSSRGSVAYTSTGTQVAANVPRYEPGKFAQAAMVEEGTENKLKTVGGADVTCTSTTGWAYNSAYGTLTVVDDPTCLGGKCLVYEDIDGDTVNGRWDGFYPAADTRSVGPVSPGDKITLSIRYKTENVTTGTVAVWGHWFGYDSAGNLVYDVPQDWVIGASNETWVAKTVINDTPNPSNYPNAAYWKYGPVKPGFNITNLGAKIYVDWVQAEIKPYATSFIDGTRSPETLTIPGSVLNPQEGTVECWVYVNDIIKRVDGVYRVIWYAVPVGGVANGYLVLDHYGNIASWRIAVKNGSTFAAYEVSDSYTPNGWHFFSLTYNATTGSIRLLIDGVLRFSTTGAPLPSSYDKLFVGLAQEGIRHCNTLIDDFRISSRARTDAEIAAAYNSNAPLTWDIDTTYLLHFDGDLRLPAERQGTWQSPVQDASSAVDQTAAVSWVVDTPIGTALSCQVRTSADGVNWSLWYDQVNGEASPAPANPYSQVRFIFQTLNGVDTPALHKATVFYEGVPAMTAIATGLGVSSVYTFAQLQDVLVVCNGVDIPKKYDGATVADITAAARFYLTAVWRDRIFGAKTSGNKSRVYYSERYSVDDWPVTYFLDINPNDGDEIVSLLPGATAFLIIKQHRTYYLQGYSEEDFGHFPAGEGGTISPWGAIWTPRGLFMLDREGVWATDFRKRSKITTDIEGIWKDLDDRNLHRSALFYWDDRLLVAVPHKTLGRILCVFDMRTREKRPWTVWTGWTPQCFLAFYERGKWLYLYGSNVSGNIFEIGESATDDGNGFTATVETAHVPLVSEEWLSRLKWCDVTFGSGLGYCDVSVIADGVAGSPKTVLVPGTQEVRTVRLFPPPWARTVGIRVVWGTGASIGTTLLGVTLAYYPRGPRPHVRVF